VLQVYGTQLSFADHGTDFHNGTPAQPATAANSLIIGTPTEVQMNLSVIAAAAAWQSVKADLGGGTATFPREWILGACMESTATPAAAGQFNFYWNPSPSATAGVGNNGNASGADEAFLIAGLPQLMPLGSLIVMAQVVNIKTCIRRFVAPYRYGSLIVVNNTDKAMVADGDADEIHVTLTPVIPDLQAAA